MQLYQGDCLEVMKSIPDNSIDMVLCDLPYGMTACKWDCVIPFEDLWTAYKRICKKNAAIVLFGSEPFSSYLRLSNIKWFKYDWIWHKSSSGGFATAKTRPMKYHEILSVFYDKQPVYNPQFQKYADSCYKRFKDGDYVNKTNCLGKNSIQQMKSCINSQISFIHGKYPESVQFFNSVPNCNGTKLHPTQKPVALCEYLIKTYTDEGMTVLDNCMGSGTTGVACVNLNRDFIGIEKDAHYFDVAKQRIEAVQEGKVKCP
jgi:site-specific DNA-methyltransferase (adenine-specific)